MFRRPSLLALAAIVGTVLAYQAIHSTFSPATSTVLTTKQPTAPATIASTKPPATMVVTPATTATPRPKKTRLAKSLPKSFDPHALNTDELAPTPVQQSSARAERPAEREEAEGKHYDKPDEAAAYYNLKREPVKGQGIPTERYAVAREIGRAHV